MLIDISINATQSEIDLSVVRRAAFLTMSAHKSVDYELSILITNDVHITELNRNYRGIGSPTDVLAFPMLEDDENSLIDSKVLGDVVISLETAKRQAATKKQSLEDEIAFLTIHGVLHLLGYDHHTPEQAKEMFDTQDAILRQMQVNTRNLEC